MQSLSNVAAAVAAAAVGRNCRRPNDQTDPSSTRPKFVCLTCSASSSNDARDIQLFKLHGYVMISLIFSNYNSFQLYSDDDGAAAAAVAATVGNGFVSAYDDVIRTNRPWKYFMKSFHFKYK